MAAVDHDKPPDIAAVGAHASRAGADVSASLRGIDGAHNYEARIVRQAIRISESRPEWPLQRIADRMVGDIDRCRTRQAVGRTQAVVDEQPEPQKPWRTLV